MAIGPCVILEMFSFSLTQASAETDRGQGVRNRGGVCSLVVKNLERIEP
jgi:hypothetical protein